MALRGIIDARSVRPIIPESVYALERFREDHWIIEVATTGKNPIPRKDVQLIKDREKARNTLNARCRRRTA